MIMEGLKEQDRLNQWKIVALTRDFAEGMLAML